MAGYRGRSTQTIVNSYPPWSKIRTDEQSLGYQFSNAPGLAMDDMRSQLERLRANFYLSTSILSDIDTFYYLSLPQSFTFEKETTDLTTLPYTPPTISGYRDGAYHAVSVSEENTIEGFWYHSVPSEINIGSGITADFLLASGTINESPFPLLATSGILEVPNQLTITLSGGQTYLSLLDNNLVRKSTARVHGITRAGQEVREEIVFLYDEAQKTQYEYQYIFEDGLAVVGPVPSGTSVIVSAANFNATDYPINYNLDTTLNDFEMPLFWAIGSGVNGTLKTLDLRKYQAEDIELRLEGFVDKEPYLQQELLNVSGVSITPIDLAVEPFSDNLWVIDQNNLYLFSSKLPAAEMGNANLKQFDAASVIQPSSYWTLLGDTIEIGYLWERPTIGMIAHRAYVVKPDGSKYSLESGAEVSYHSDSSSWIIGEPRERTIRAAEFYTLDQRGEYIYTLEAKYTDYSTSIDQRIITVLAQEAIAQYSLNIPSPAFGIDIDSEYKLWVLDNNRVRYPITMKYDNCLIDFVNKVLYFRDEYSQVRIY